MSSYSCYRQNLHGRRLIVALRVLHATIAHKSRLLVLLASTTLAPLPRAPPTLSFLEYPMPLPPLAVTS